MCDLRESDAETNALVESMKQLGSPLVVLDTLLNSNFKEVQKLSLDTFGSLPLLGLNAVGGDSSTNIFRSLA